MIKRCLLVGVMTSLLLSGCSFSRPVPNQTDIYKAEAEEDISVADLDKDQEKQEPQHKDDEKQKSGESFDDVKKEKPEDMKKQHSNKEISYEKYYKYMLGQEGDNIMFSPESLNTAFAIYSELLDDEDWQLFDDFLGGRNYLGYESNDTFKTINRLWVNKDCDFHVPDGPLSDIVYLQDMTDSEKATKIKNDYVAGQTNNFITETPTIFTMDTICDSMNVVYFKDKWLDGDKILDDETTPFENIDGSLTDVKMFNDEGHYVFKTDNAAAYSMPYEDGFTLTVILPESGYTVDDIDIDRFIKNDFDETLETTVYFKMPEFETKSVFKCDFSDFDLPLNPKLSDGITSERVDAPEITQVDRIKVDHKGTEAAAVTEVIMKNSAMPMQEEPYYFTVNRPFAYFIHDTLNDDIAFVGVVRNMNE